MIFVLYHASCSDGAGAKYAAWKKYGDEATYIPVQYNQPLPKALTSLSAEELKEAEVYILDFSYDRDTLVELNEQVKKLIVLDHHKTAKEVLEGLDFAIFDMDKSGAVLAWEFFHPIAPVPRLLLHVQDRDLWQFKLEHTKEIHVLIGLDRDNMDHWEMLNDAIQASLMNEPAEYNALIESASGILQYIESQVLTTLRKVKVFQIGDYRVGVANVVNNISEVGHAICNDENLNVDYSMTYFITPDARVVFSFRSKEGSGVDVSRIASAIKGGGGHPHSAGASTGLDFLIDLLSQPLAD